MTGLFIRKDGIEREAVYPANASVLVIAEAIRKAKREIQAEIDSRDRAIAISVAAQAGNADEVVRLAISRQCHRGRKHKQCRQLNCACECHAKEKA